MERLTDPDTSELAQLRAMRDGLTRLHEDAQRWLTESDDRPNLRAAEHRIAKLLKGASLTPCSEYQRPDPRIGRLVEWFIEAGGRHVARVVAIEPGSGMLLVRQDDWRPEMMNYRLNSADHANVFWPVVSHEDAARFRAAMKLVDPEMIITTAWRPEGGEPTERDDRSASSAVELPADFEQRVLNTIRRYGEDVRALLLRSPAGRAAIAECMRRPPERMPDGTWREPTPGHTAKPGDVVRLPNGGRHEVYRIGARGELWLIKKGDGLPGCFTVQASDAEVVRPAEATAPAATPLASDRQRTPPDPRAADGRFTSNKDSTP